MPLTLVRAETLLDGTGAPAIRGGAAVLIEDDTIREVGPRDVVTRAGQRRDRRAPRCHDPAGHRRRPRPPDARRPERSVPCARPAGRDVDVRLGRRQRPGVPRGRPDHHLRLRRPWRRHHPAPRRDPGGAGAWPARPRGRRPDHDDGRPLPLAREPGGHPRGGRQGDADAGAAGCRLRQGDGDGGIADAGLESVHAAVRPGGSGGAGGRGASPQPAGRGALQRRRGDPPQHGGRHRHPGPLQLARRDHRVPGLRRRRRPEDGRAGDVRRLQHRRRDRAAEGAGRRPTGVAAGGRCPRRAGRSGGGCSGTACGST